ncbi:MAG: 50S ribosomal protein L10 [Alphaproteobacteria bacterium]|nr:50S ribosomal protein L10 [Alphaproteobacteria bacterium]
MMNAEFKASSLVVVCQYNGLTVAETEALRSKVRESGAKFRVTKNRITRLALAGTQFESLADLLKGPSAVSYSADPIAAAKAVVKYAKENEKLSILGGVMNGEVLTAAQVKALGELPSLDELRGKLVGLLQAPAGQIARVCKAYADKEQAA